jgi:RHS repeat-associated protein
MNPRANQLATFNGQTVTHDLDGNMVSGPLPSTGAMGNYTYDSRNRLTVAGGFAYRYNAEGNRVGLTSTNETTTLTVDPQGALPKVLERVKNGVRTRYVYGAGLQYEVNDAGAATYYHYDQSGNTAALTNQAGAIIERVVYSPYGTIRYRQSNYDTPFLYGGFFGVMTDANGLINMRARYYNPLTMRFLNSDPAMDGLNWYAYAGGNPISNSDPSGLADSTTAWQLGWEWATGTGPRHHDFTDGDPFAELLRQHSNIQQGFQEASQKAAIAAQQGQSSTTFSQDYRLDGLQGVPKYLNDYSTLATGGATGNLAVTFLGSYQATVSVSNINANSGTASAQVVVRNTSNFASGTRPPVLGYTPAWQQYVAPAVNSFFTTGPGSPTTQSIVMNQTVHFSSRPTSSRK